MQLEMKDPESIHSPNTETVIGNYRWNGDLKTKFQAKENMTLISRVKKKQNPSLPLWRSMDIFWDLIQQI